MANNGGGFSCLRRWVRNGGKVMKRGLREVYLGMMRNGFGMEVGGELSV